MRTVARPARRLSLFLCLSLSLSALRSAVEDRYPRAGGRRGFVSPTPRLIFHIHFPALVSPTRTRIRGNRNLWATFKVSRHLPLSLPPPNISFFCTPLSGRTLFSSLSNVQFVRKVKPKSAKIFGLWGWNWVHQSNPRCMTRLNWLA